MSKHRHRFEVIVSTELSEDAAKTAILSAFAGREPDGCHFDLSSHPGDQFVVTPADSRGPVITLLAAVSEDVSDLVTDGIPVVIHVEQSKAGDECQAFVCSRDSDETIIYQLEHDTDPLEVTRIWLGQGAGSSLREALRLQSS